MKTKNVRVKSGIRRLSKRNVQRLRQAVARRRLQELHDEKVLQGWLAEVWDESPSTTNLNSSVHLH